jgi:ferredoxin-NADP reductase
MQNDPQILLIRPLGQDCFVLRCTRGDLKFDAGQLVSLGPRGFGINREYSIYSGEKDDYLEFLIRRIRNGTVSKLLFDLKPHDKVFVLGPYSNFRIKNTLKSNRPHWLIATGTGIAPFHSMVRSYPELNYKIIHGVRTSEEMYDREDYSVGRYVACISGTKSHLRSGLAGMESAFSGRVTSYLEQDSLPNNAIFYLCGNKNMINETFEILLSKGVSSDDIHSEVFF